MNQSRKYSCRALVAHHQSKVLQPRVSALNDPPALVTPQLPAILMCGYSVFRSSKHNWLNVTLEEKSANFVAVIAAVRNQSLGLVAISSATSDTSILQRRLQQCYL